MHYSYVKLVSGVVIISCRNFCLLIILIVRNSVVHKIYLLEAFYLISNFRVLVAYNLRDVLTFFSGFSNIIAYSIGIAYSGMAVVY